MKTLLIIAAAEWRYWLNSFLALSGAILFAVLIITTSILNAFRMQAEHHDRTHHQDQAEETFLAQPDRHPHRMVHYGHYVFREPAPLAIFDPGLDPVTGQSIFLEGHRQNTAMFAQAGASANLGGFSWLTPALVYQLFAPLLIILLGHGAVVRERESKTLAPILAQGVGGCTLIWGKGLALISFIILMLIPVTTSACFAFAKGESALATMALPGFYFIYLATWGLLVLFVSSTLNNRRNVLATLIACWLGLTLALPSAVVNLATIVSPFAGKIEQDLKMKRELQKLGDGHNANDPAFANMRADLLRKYNVDRIEDLPINFRGMVALNAEAKLTSLLNQYAADRMAAETNQASVLNTLSWFSPTLAIAQASRSISATDLTHYHLFLKQAEVIRFEFVQGLNRAHVEKLSYQDDINRNKNEESWARARVSANNWQVLNAFEFEPASAVSRLARALQPLAVLLVWGLFLCVGLFWSGRRLSP